MNVTRNTSCRLPALATILAASALVTLPARADFILAGDANSTTSAVGNDDVITFTQSGTLTVTGSGTVDLLAVGGGGGGGAIKDSDKRIGGAGGGAGGLVYRQSVAVTEGTYAITVGAGGIGGGTTSAKVDGTNGGDTTAFGFTAYGGGGGASWGGRVGLSGGSGGGSTSGWDTQVAGGTAIYASANNIGHDGNSSTHAYLAGGGGGASGTYDTSTSRNGQDGVAIAITGQSVYYAGGGAGHRSDGTSIGGLGGGGDKDKAGTNGLGGGGAGGRNGGSGIVIVRYTPVFSDSTAFTISGDANAATLTLHDGNALVFTNSGTLTITGKGILDILAVGGGGGGGSGAGSGGDGTGAGGGGGGGFVYTNSVSVHAGTYSVTVGEGGAGATGTGGEVRCGSNGGDSSVLGITAYGGGGGGGHSGFTGRSGATGGGSTHKWDSDGVTIAGGTAIHGDQGFDGGSSTGYYKPGGGGGAGAAAEPNAITSPGKPGYGGDGRACDITGVSVYYGGGGAGYRTASSVADTHGGLGGGGNACAGTDGLGGGGGGGPGDAGAYGYAGGSGVVVVRLRRSATPVASEPATGGTIIRVGSGYRAHKFTSDGTLVVPKSIVADVLLVGGGGGGGANRKSNIDFGGAGGGAGGLVYQTNIVIAAGTYTVAIGAGGTGGGTPDGDAKVNGTNGGNTTAFGFTAYGGGGGASWGGGVGSSGGSGGGSTSGWDKEVAGGTAIYAFAHNIGHDGHKSTHAYIAGGGGGAGETYDTSTIRNGQDGLAIDITGQPVYYAGGGSGDNGWARTPANGGLGGGGGRSHAGTDGLGGGGGGGANGGSGVVIIRYRYEPGTIIVVK